MKKLSFIFILPCLTWASMLEGDLLNALDGGWGAEYQTKANVKSSPRKTDPQIEGNKTSLGLNCNSEEDRNTVPYKFLLGLMANKNLDIEHKPHAGTLEFNGGIMIGNCQSMLETFVSKPSSDIPYYTFQVAVKRPGGCKTSKCSYDVAKVESGNSVKHKMEFAPSFSGFVDCLKASGVYADGKIDQKKVAPIEFTHTERDITQSSEVVYANRGYKGTRYAGQFSSNKLPEYPGCYYFEDVKEGGFKTYSVDDIKDYELERLYQKVCNSGNYKLINKHVMDFDENGPFQKGLIDIRNELILGEVKRLHEIVDESEDLSEVDAVKFKEVTSDFLDYVVKPLKNDLAQLQRLYANPGHSQKEKILNSVFGPEKAKAYLGKDPKELKELLKADLDEKASQLVNYARKPYLTKDDYKKMASKESKAPLENSTWTSAVLDVYETHNTAFNYGRYSDDFWESHYKDNKAYANEKRYESASVLNSKISKRLREKRSNIKRVSEVAANPGVDYGAKYERTKNAVIGDIDLQIQKYNQSLQKAIYQVRTQCAQEKAQKYWINQQRCVREAQARIEACTRQIEALKKSRSKAVAKYDAMIAEWKDAQSQAGLSSKSKNSKKKNSKGTQTFDFDPGSTANVPNSRNMVNNNAYSNQLRRQQAMMMQRQNQMYQMPQYQNQQNMMMYNNPYQQSYSPMYGNQNGLSAGLNFNLGANMSPYSNQSYYSNYRQPSYYSNSYPAMQYFGQQNTTPGGMYNFGLNGSIGAGNYMPAYSPMAPGYQNSGASSTFTFGF